MPTRFATETSAPDLRQSAVDGMLSGLSGQQLSLHGKMINGLIPGVPPVPRTLLPGVGADIAVGDWDALFNAVKERLICIAYTADTRPKSVADQVSTQIRIDLLECVAALDQLHATVTVELARR